MPIIRHAMRGRFTLGPNEYGIPVVISRGGRRVQTIGRKVLTSVLVDGPMHANLSSLRIIQPGAHTALIVKD